MNGARFGLRTLIFAVVVGSMWLNTTTILTAQVPKSHRNNASTQALQITINTDSLRTKFNVGDPIQIEILVENISKAPVSLVESCYSLDYALTVRNERGEEVRLTKEGRRLTNASEVICHSRMLKLTPGGATRVNINASHLYDMSSKGTYYVKASRAAQPSNGKAFRSESNTVRIKVK